MNAPLSTQQQNAVDELQRRARALGLPFELHFNRAWNIVLVVDGREFASIEGAAEHLSKREVAR